MKYWVYQLLVLIVLIAVGYWTRYSDWFPLVFGLVLGAYGVSYSFFDYKRKQAKDEREYEEWVKEMDARSQGNNLEF